MARSNHHGNDDDDVVLVDNVVDNVVVIIVVVVVVVVVYPPRYRQSLREMSTASYIHAKAQKRRRPPLRWIGRRRGGRRVCRQDVVERGQSD